MADVPAEETDTSAPARTCRAIASASGLRHVLPEHTNRIFFKPPFPNRRARVPPPAMGVATWETAWNYALSGAGNDTNNELTLQRIPTN
jgi:hypothetical protein